MLVDQTGDGWKSIFNFSKLTLQNLEECAFDHTLCYESNRSSQCKRLQNADLAF